MAPFLIKRASSASAPVSGKVMPTLIVFCCACRPVMTATPVKVATPAIAATLNARRVCFDGFIILPLVGGLTSVTPRPLRGARDGPRGKKLSNGSGDDGETNLRRCAGRTIDDTSALP